mmetsp:Transcript_46021/g.75081  ORF Transcript_46021/g.75081 Transcript_46021/m.75081 type:complete len:172 (+) Transcript_46021:155-670(+)
MSLTTSALLRRCRAHHKSVISIAAFGQPRQKPLLYGLAVLTRAQRRVGGANFPKIANDRYHSTEAATSESKRPLIRQQIKELIKKYGKLAVVTYLTIAAFSFSSVYCAIYLGVDLKPLLESFNINIGSTNNRAAALAVSFAIHSALTPVRVALTLAVVPILSRTLRMKASI